jgi:fructose-bisphosphate aldolase, class II
MPHVTLKRILSDAQERRYGIPCPATANLEMLIGIIRAAEEKEAPVIICYNKQLTPDIPIEMIMPVMVREAKKSTVPVATILDHGSDFDLIMKAIHYGASSVMFDGSGLPFEENISRTKEIVKIAHSLGVSVEAELGGVGGNVMEATPTSASESLYTDPAEAVEFVDRTGVDCLAISFGNVHGKYAGEPNLDLQLVKRISSSVNVPLGMHGASGLEFSEYKNIIEAGISKINYFSAICALFHKELSSFIERVGEEALCVRIIKMTIDYWHKKTMELFDILGTSRKAKNF